MRVAIVASQTETGWETIASQWRSATLAWIGWPEQKISDAEPDAQAEFWLRETERVLQATPDSAAMHMGAAWTLDGPAIGFMKRHIKPPAPASPFTQTDPQAFGETLRQANAHFEQRCQAKCLEFAARATDLEPTDVRWWRMRAILLFNANVGTPRTADWDSVLIVGAQHDPDNALYDYLAALHYWKQSAAYDIDPDGLWRLQVTDAAQYEQGTERFLRGQTKPYLAIGEAGYPAIADMLAKTNLRQDDQAEVAVSRRVTSRHSMLFYQLARWQFWQAEAAQQANNAEQELAMRRRNLRLYDQVIAPAETSSLELKMRFAELQPRNYQALRYLHAEHPELLSSAEIAKLSQREQTLSSEAATLRASIAAYHQQQATSGIALVAAIAAGMTSLACVPLALLALLALLAWCLARRLSATTTEAPPFGWLRYIVTWIGSFVASFVVLGLAPAQVISIDVQKWLALGMLGCLAIAGTGLAAWLIWHLAGRRQVRFSLRAAFVAMTCVAVLAALWPLFEPIVASILQRPTELWMPARGWDYLDAETLRVALQVDVGSWSWAAVQWLAYRGFFVGVGLALLSSTLWYARRCLNGGEDSIQSLSKPLLQFLGLSARRAAWACLAIYLLMAPTSIQLQEAAFLYKMQYCRNPAAHIDALLAGPITH